MAVGQRRPWPLAERPLRPLGAGLGLVLGGLGLGLLPAPLAAVVGLGSLAALLVVVRPVWGLVALAFAAPFLSAWRLAGGLTLTEGLVGALAAGLFLGIGARRAPGLVLTPWVLPVVAMALGTLWGVSLAPDLAPAFLEVLRWVELGTVAIITATLCRAEGPRRWLVAGLLVAGGLSALLGFYQFFTRTGPPSFAIGPFLRAYGTFGQPNPYGGYLAMALGPALGLALFWPAASDRWRWGSRLAAGLMGTALGLSLSRGALLGVAVGGLVVALLAGRTTRWLALGGLALTGVALLLGLGGLLPPVVAGRLAQVVAYFGVFDPRTVPLTPENWAVVERMAHWWAALEMFATAPLFGVGPGQYTVLYPLFRVPGWEDPLGHAHNIYLHMLAEQGVFGLALYLLMVGSWWLLAWRTWRRGATAFDRALALGVLGSLTAVLVHNMFDNLHVHGMNVHQGLLVGLLAACRRSEDRG